MASVQGLYSWLIRKSNARVISYMIRRDGRKISQPVPVNDRNNIDTIIFLTAWNVAVGGYPF